MTKTNILTVNHPLISIIIPCYNAEKFIFEAIESALNQTYSKVEVIVIDDGSSDRSVEVIQSFGDRVRFEAIDHKGACAARNRGLQLSKGEYIQFLDADDLLVANKIESQLPFLIDDRADLVFCKGYIFGDGRGLRPKKSIIKSPHNVDPFIYCLNQGLSTEGALYIKEVAWTKSVVLMRHYLVLKKRSYILGLELLILEFICSMSFFISIEIMMVLELLELSHPQITCCNFLLIWEKY